MSTENKNIPRPARRRIKRMMEKFKDMPYEVAEKMETDRCPDCNAGYCPCGQSDLPHIKVDHHQCMHRRSRCSVRVADLIDADKLKSLERLEEVAKKEESPV